MKGLYTEKKEYMKARFNTLEGIFEFIFASLIFGFIIVNYTTLIYETIISFLTFLPSFFQTWVGYMVYGIILVPIGMIITLILTELFKVFFKNGRIIK